MRLTIDFETRSRADLKACGAWAYAEHPSTEVLCLAGQEGRGRPFPVDLDNPAHFLDIMGAADEIEAHNVEFELAIWTEVLEKRRGWPRLPRHKLRCSAARAAMAGLPRSLAMACKALKLPEQKDNDGYKLMMRMCKPKRDGSWHDTPEDRARLMRYCLQDVEAEYALSEALPPMPAQELLVFQTHLAMNERGFRVDLENAQSLQDLVELEEARLLKRWRELTSGVVASPRQIAATIRFIKARFGVTTDTLDADAVRKLRAKNEDPVLEELLEIRAQLGKSSTAKIKSLQNAVSADGRLRGSLLYYGAGTGRWSGQRFQPQNLPSRGLAVKHHHVESVYAACPGGPGLVDMLYGSPMHVASACIRGLITASLGRRLVCADYSAIEGRVLAWLADEAEVLDAYAAGRDTYKLAASKVFHKPYEAITDSERSVGKVIELQCGYQGNVGAFQTMAKSYGIDSPDEEVRANIKAWREARHRTVALWYEMEDAASNAVRDPGTVTFAAGGKIAFRVTGRWLRMRLPSGRQLFYFAPHFAPKAMPWVDDKTGEPVTKMSLSFWGVDSTTRQWGRQYTYGGCLTENACQAVARDLMASALVALEHGGHEPVLTVHDEAVCDPGDGTTLDTVAEIMCRLPEWAAGLPLAAEGWEGFRYRK